MIRKVRVENYKSISDLTFGLGRVTVFIGSNGSGKSNILEAIALASAATQNKLDNEFLISRGIRVTETRFMRCAFDGPPMSHDAIKIMVEGDNQTSFACEIAVDESGSYPKWRQNFALLLGELFPSTPGPHRNTQLAQTLEQLFTTNPGLMEGLLASRSGSLPRFLIYAPENSALRTFQAEGQILPLGIRGEGLFAHLKGLSAEPHRSRLARIKDELSLIDWFENFDVPDDLGPGERTIRIRDRFLAKDALFDQRSANEGFLFLLFYITLFISPDTPAFFSIDNIDASLNPKLCIALLELIVKLAKEFDKQVILTTHNPAVLDGLNINDDDQKLLVVDRNKTGHTRVRRVDPPRSIAGQPLVSLSEAFMRGLLGGLPKHF